MRRSHAAPLALLAGLICIAALWGGWLDRTLHFHLNAAPLFAEWRPRVGFGAAVAVAVAIVVVSRSVWFDRLPFRRLLVWCFVASCAWGVSLSLVDGTRGLTMGITGPHGHLTIVDWIDPPAEFVRTFVDRISSYTVHVRSHPPALMVAVWWLYEAGLRSTAIAAIVIAFGASVVVAVLVTAREVVDATSARRAAPYLVLAPAALWMVTTFDAVYAAAAAWGITLVCLATGARRMRGDALALSGGLVLGLALFLSYGIAALGTIPFAVGVWRRAWRSLVVAGLGVASVFVAFRAWGFWWFDGLAATRDEYLKGIASIRPYWYFVIANLAAFAIAVGPAAVAGVARLVDRRAWILVGAALVAVVVADVSGFSKGEVERIWLPFWPWVALAAAALPVAQRRWWLGAQAVIVVGVQSLFFIPW